MNTYKANLLDAVRLRREKLIEAARQLTIAASPNPPGDVTAAADAAVRILETIPGIELSRHETAPGIVNLVGVIKSGKPGRRLIFNGHLDTYPIGEDLGWTVPPLGAVISDGKLYGRGISDMKAGIAASIIAADVMAENRAQWCGEIVVTLAGDEESMGTLGSGWLLENVEAARGDAMICGDVGSPSIVRFGEKGLVWIEISASGTAAHGAHVHKGINAIDRLRTALDAVQRLEELPTEMPAEITRAITEASSKSEALSGLGESLTLQRVTVNIGTIKGGISPNLVPSEAVAQGDIRLPVGVSTKTIENKLAEWLLPMEGVQYKIIRRYEPTFTSPQHPIIVAAMNASREVLGDEPVANMRVGASDTRLYRAVGIPSVVLGCTPNNMGAADEYVDLDEMLDIARMHALAAQEFLALPAGSADQ